MNTEKKVWFIIVFFAILFAYGLWSAFRPASYPLKFVRGEVRPVAENIIIGPYPTEEEFKKLRYDLGVDEVVSLMDPSSRVEGGFVKEEKERAAALGLSFRNFPMDFLNLSGEANRNELKSLLAYLKKEKGKKFYVHCYLGRHRVGLVAEAFKAQEDRKTRQRARQ